MDTKQNDVETNVETAVPAKVDAPTPIAPLPKAAETPKVVRSIAQKPVSTSSAPKAPKVAAKKVQKKAPLKEKAAAAQPKIEAASVSTGVKSMNDFVMKFAEETKARTEAMTAEFGERAKDMFAKSNKLAEDAAAFNKSNIEAVVESSKIAAKNLEVLRDESLSFARKSFEDQSLAMKSLTSVKSPADFFKLIVENNKKAFDAAVAQTSKNSEMLVKMSTDSFAPISNRMSVITSQLKVA